ncbi:MAG: CRTAC1 family protein [Candidatus Wenzhouxiangella sp. M2_3B_020]
MIQSARFPSAPLPFLPVFALALALIAGAPGSADADTPSFEFDARTVATYLPSPGMGTGVAAADYDADGDPDIFLPTGGGVPNRLYRNRGDGTFDEIAAAVGLDDTRQARTALWVDYDGDGDLDLFVGRDCHATDFDGISATLQAAAGSCGAPVLSLYEQRPGGFVDVTESVGLFATAGSLPNLYHAGGLSAGDISGDGLPDIYFARWQAVPELYVSDTLTIDGGEAPGYSLGSGLTSIGDYQAGHWQGLFHDFDRDGLLDLFVNVDFTANQLWLNRADFSLVDDAGAAGIDSAWNEMGLTAGDYDNDGDIDLYITNIYAWNGQGSHNLLFRNDSVTGAPLFTERAEVEGIADTAWGWGTTWLDADNDGDLDLAATNGYCEIPIPDEERYCDPVHERDRSRFFEQTETGFVEVGELVGFADTLIGAGLVAADFDGDGRQDLLQAAIDPDSVPWEDSNVQPRTERLTLYFNRPVGGGGQGRHAWVRPVWEASGAPALGAVVRLVLDNGEILTRLVQAGESWMGQAPSAEHFGIPEGASVLRMEIRWPAGGGTSVLPAPPDAATTTVVGPEIYFASDFESG